MKIKDYTEIPLYSFGGTKKQNPTIGEFFERVIGRSVKTSHFEIIELSENILMVSAIIEKIIKDNLIAVNPALILKNIDTETICLLANKKAKLATSPASNFEIHSAPITELIKRFFLLKQGISNCESSLYSFFKIRNALAHPLESTTIDFTTANLLLTKNAIPFLKNYITISDDLWGQFTKIQMVAHDAYKSQLVKSILDFRTEAKTIKPEEVARRKSQKATLSQVDGETIFGKDLVCPACFNETMDIIIGIDVDWNPDGVIDYPYLVTRCRVCNLEFSEPEFKEILEDSKSYFKDGIDMTNWRAEYDALYNDRPDLWQYV